MALKTSTGALEYVSPAFKDDGAMMGDVVASDGGQFKHSLKRLRGDLRMILLALEKTWTHPLPDHYEQVEAKEVIQHVDIDKLAT